MRWLLDSQHYRAVQKHLAQGWNTWDVNSVTTHVLLPDGLAIHIGLHRLRKNSTLQKPPKMDRTRMPQKRFVSLG